MFLDLLEEKGVQLSLFYWDSGQNQKKNNPHPPSPTPTIRYHHSYSAMTQDTCTVTNIPSFPQIIRVLC